MTEDTAVPDYDAVWSRTQVSNPRIESGGFADQRERGLTEEYVCWVRIDDPVVLDALRPLRAELGSIPGVHLDNEETLHVTLKLIGFGPSDSGEAPDEISAEQLDRLADEFEGIGTAISSFGVSIQGLNAFPSVVFAEPHADGQFQRIHDDICGLDEVLSFQYEGDEYVPHVSLAHFETVAGFEQALSWVHGHRTIQVPQTTVTQFELVSLPLTEYRADDVDVIRRVELSS